MVRRLSLVALLILAFPLAAPGQPAPGDDPFKGDPFPTFPREERPRRETSGADTATFLGGLLCCSGFTLIFSLVPGVVATMRKHPNQLPIWIICILFGWSLIGWAVALVWACMAIPEVETEPAPRRKKRKRIIEDEDED